MDVCNCPPSCRPDGSDGTGRAPGRFLVQRILGTGSLHRRNQLYCLYPENIPSQVKPPYAIVDVTTGGEPAWEEEPCPERCALLLRVYIPLLLRIRDSNNCLFTVCARIEDTFRLRLSCPEQESWRGQIFVQAAVRLCGGACSCGNRYAGGNGCQPGRDFPDRCRANGCCDCRPLCPSEGIQTPLEVMLEGFLLVSCPVGGAQPPCPPPKPWYPEPCVDRFCR